MRERERERERVCVCVLECAYLIKDRAVSTVVCAGPLVSFLCTELASMHIMLVVQANNAKIRVVWGKCGTLLFSVDFDPLGGPY